MKKNALLLFACLLFTMGAMASSVSGVVDKITSGLPAYPAKVLLIHKTYSSVLGAYELHAVDSTTTDTGGFYQFLNVNLPAGDLLVKAALTPANPDYLHYLPTYKEDSLTWHGAHPASFTANANNIHLLHGNNPGGPAFIGGSVLQGANKPTGVGDPLSNKIIFLTTAAGDAVAYTYSDASGQFSFSNLAYGSYKLFGDVWGKDNTELLVTVNAAGATINNVTFEENSTSFSGHIGATGIGTTLINSTVQLYPNPATNAVTISGLGSDLKTISLISVNGSVLSVQTTTATQATIPVSQLATGMYLLQVSGSQGNSYYKFTK